MRSPMDRALRRAYDAGRTLPSKALASACYAPFVSMYFKTSGEVSVCCESQTYPIGNVASRSLDEIWNGARLDALRTAVAEYRLPAACEFCSWQIASGDLRGVTARQFDAYPVEHRTPRWPLVMEFALSNVCNLECVMCCGEYSSLIRSRRDHLPPLQPAYGDRFFLE